jgi:RHS repeat-associated protein
LVRWDDGLDRRTAIARTPAGGGSAVTTSYLWCGSAICQARDATNAVTREYYAEGELVPGTPPQILYCGADQIGTVRRVFASTSSAPAYSYDPYGVPLQATAPLTDFTYAGMFHDADSGLDLTKYRAYDPIAGRWLSRDPLGEVSDPVGNLYLYVGGNPISIADALGLCGDEGFWSKVLQILAANPLLIPEIVGTEVVGGGPEDPAADIAVLAEIEAAVESIPSSTLTVEEAGAELAQQIGKNRVSVMTSSGRMQIDLAGKPHFEKSLGQEIPTPHVKFQNLNVAPNGRTNLSPGTVRPATMNDIRTAQKIINRRGN